MRGKYKVQFLTAFPLLCLFIFCINSQLSFANTLSPETVLIPTGKVIIGSDPKEREYGYQLDEVAYGHSRTRQLGWYDGELKRSTILINEFYITKNLITNAQYAQFLLKTKHRFPHVTKATWEGYQLIHPYSRAKHHMWSSRIAPKERENHPVTMVSYQDALAYADWLSEETGRQWQLPNEAQWTKAMRGADGRYFPWGNTFDPHKLNSHDKGPFDTVPVATYPKASSPYGVLDGAGQVFEWTETPGGAYRHIVKGGSWDDRGCGACRIAARHSRPDTIKHILIGFRLVRITKNNDDN